MFVLTLAFKTTKPHYSSPKQFQILQYKVIPLSTGYISQRGWSLLCCLRSCDRLW